MTKEKKFPKGLFAKKPHDKAPDFIITNISLKRQELIDWLNSQTDEWINIDAKISKDGKHYVEVNDWKPEKKAEQTEGKEEDDDLPF